MNKSTVSGNKPGAVFLIIGSCRSFQKSFSETADLPLSRGYPIEGLRSPIVRRAAAWLLENKNIKDELALDHYEGYPKFYYKAEMKLPVTGIRSGRTRTRTVFVYVMDESRFLLSFGQVVCKHTRYLGDSFLPGGKNTTMAGDDAIVTVDNDGIAVLGANAVRDLLPAALHKNILRGNAVLDSPAEDHR